ncbi:hypothetical protein [Burkholderia thailandensis]|uniref:hypothetical protein n=1 Tax=Burkholderia thailandensis TaxID=57975 RepID=UPI000FD6ADC6|nr:hypothetical protein [Burkholderia thailandensis]
MSATRNSSFATDIYRDAAAHRDARRPRRRRRDDGAPSRSRARVQPRGRARQLDSDAMSTRKLAYIGSFIGGMQALWNFGEIMRLRVQLAAPFVR